VLRASKEPDFQQDRARKSWSALIEAATKLFEKHGYDATGTPEIAQAAGVSVGTFYRYFEDKHEVYLEVARRMMLAAYADTLEHLTPERFVGKARHETIAETIEVLFNHVLSRPQLMRSFVEMSLRDPAVAELRRAFDVISVQRMTALVAAVTTRAVVPDPEATAYVIYAAGMESVYGLAFGRHKLFSFRRAPTRIASRLMPLGCRYSSRSGWRLAYAVTRHL
jgi:AcrR family transcriptional regulator